MKKKTSYFSKKKEVEVIEHLRIVKNFEFLIDSINSFERNTSKTKDQIQILKVAISKLKKIDWLVEKVDTVIQKNPDINFFMNYSYVTCLKTEKIFEYVPLVSVSAERSFSLLKILLTDRRTNKTTEKLEMLLILYYNT